MTQDRFLTVKEFACRIKMSRSWVFEQIKQGLIPVVYLPGNVRRIDWFTFEEQITKPQKQVSSLKTEQDRRPSSYDPKGLTWLD